jgi:hypothetical protein
VTNTRGRNSGLPTATLSFESKRIRQREAPLLLSAANVPVDFVMRDFVVHLANSKLAGYLSLAS